MNHIYKSIFNKALGVFTAVPEFASAHGKGSERTVVGRVAKGTAGFAASALAISVGLALTSTSAVGYPGIYINDRQAGNCLAINDSAVPNLGVGTILDVNSTPGSVVLKVPGTYAPQTGITPSYYNAAGSARPCAAIGNSTVDNRETQTNRTLFYGGPGAATEADEVNNENNGAKNLTLGGRLDVNSGIIGVGDRGVNGDHSTNSIRMGMGTALSDANKQVDAITIGVNAGASAKHATAIGSATTAKTGYSTALGYQAQAGDPAVTNFNGEYATAIGGKAKALHAYTTALGAETNASGAYATAVGNEAKATHESTTAVGKGAKATNDFATAVGQLALASGKNGTAVGTRNEALGEEATALGYHSHANGSQQLSIGAHAGRNLDGSFSQSTHGISIGSLAGADNATAKSNDDSVLIGTESGRYAQGGNRNTSIGKSAGQYLKGNDNIAMGTDAGSGTATDKLEVNDTIAIGKSAKATNNWATAIGSSAVASGGSASQALGYDAVASGKSAIAQGFHSHADGQSAVAIGDNAKASGIATVSVGYMANGHIADVDKDNTPSTTKATYGTAVGHYAGADYVGTDNLRSTALGNQAGRYGEGGSINTAVGNQAGMYVKGSQNVAMGHLAGSGDATNKLEVNNTVSIGTSSKASANSAIAMGNTAQASSSNATAISTEANARTAYSIAMGYKAVAGDNSAGAPANGTSAIAIGNQALANYYNAIALGQKAKVNTGADGIAIGSETEVNAYKGTAIGAYAQANGSQALAIGNNKQGQSSVASGEHSQVIGVESNVSGQDSTAIGYKNTVESARTYAMGNNISVSTNAVDSLALGSAVKVDGDSAIALGKNAAAAGNNQIAIGVNASRNTTGGANHSSVYSVAIGTNAGADNVSTATDGNTEGVAIGYNAGRHVGTGIHNSAIGLNSGMYIQGSDNIAFGSNAGSGKKDAVLDINRTVAIGANALASKNNAVSIGGNSKAEERSTVAIGDTATANGQDQISIGHNAGADAVATAKNAYGIALGLNAGRYQQGGEDNYAIGQNAGQYVNGTHSVALGLNAGSHIEGDGNFAAADGAGNYIKGRNNIAIGNNAGSGAAGAIVEADRTISLGTRTQARANNAIAIGTDSKGLARNTTAIGQGAEASANFGMAMGSSANSSAENAIAVGNGATAANANSVALGAGSTTADINTGDYTLNTSYTAAGLPVAANGTVSVGSAGKERQIQNVAAGVISATSTDAINGSQLYATNNYLSNLAGGVKNVLGGDAAVDNAGNVTMSNIGDTGEGTVHGAIKNLKDAIDSKVDTTASVTSEDPADIKVDKEAPVGNTTNYKLSLGNDAKAKLAKAATALQTVEGDSNITATKDATDPTKVKLALNKNLTADSVTLGDTTTADYTMLNKDGLTVGTGGPVLSSSGIDMRSGQIRNLVGGPVKSGERTAVSAGMLYDVAQSVKDAIGGETQLDSDDPNKSLPAGRLTLSNVGETGENTIHDAIKSVNDKAKTAVQEVESENPTALSVKKDGTKVTLTPNFITGDLVNADGTVNAPAAADEGKLVSAKTVADALKANHFVVDTKGNTETGSEADAKVGSGNKVTFEAGNNLVAKQANTANGGATVKFSLKDDISLNSVTAGTGDNQVVLGNDGVKVGGNTYINNDGLNANSKVISNVAAGVKPTDAVNKDQLDAVKNVADSAVKSVDTVASEENLVVDNNDPQNPKLRLKKAVNLTSIKLDGATPGNTTYVSGYGLTIEDGPSVKKEGINAGDKKITNVAAGDVSATSKDAVNGAQLHNVASSVANVLGGNAAVDGNGNVTSSDIGGTGANTVDDAIKAVNAAAAKHTTVVEGKNVKVTKGKNAAGGDEYTVATKDDLDVTSVTAGNTTVNTNGLTITGGPSVTRGGIDAGDRVISNVKAGDVSATSQEAVNGSQLHATNTKLDGVKAKADTAVQDVKSGDENALTAVKDPNTNIVTVTPKLSGDLVDANGNITAPTAAADKGKLVTAGTVAEALANTHFVVDTKATDGELDGASQADQKIKAGNKVTLQAGKNLKAKQTNGTDGAKVEFSLKDSISLTQVTVGEGSANEVVLNDKGVNVGGKTYINNDGLNANSKVISNVADGVNPNDAVNKGQLDAVKGVADSAVKSVNVANGEENLVVDNTDPKNPKLSLKKDLTVDSVKAGDSTLNTDGLTIAGGPSVKKDGIDAGDKKIANVAAGDVSATSKDAVNGGQLYNVANNVKDLIGPDATIDPATGKVTVADPAKGIGETGKGNIGEAIKHVNDAAKAAADTAKKHTTVEQGDNIVVEESLNAEGGKHYKVSTAKNLNVDSVKAGDTTVNNDGVTINNGPSMTKDGINANNKVISNVADGVNTNDAVNKGQLDAVKGVADSAVKSVNVANGEENLVVDNTDPKNPKLSLKKDLTVDSVKAGDTTVNNDGLTIAGGPSVKKDGIDAADKKITNVEAGNVAENSKDAVNGGQLYDVAKNVADLVGPDAKIDPATGKVTVADPAKGIGETGKGNIGDAIKHVNDAVKAAADTAKKHTTVEQGDNIVVEESLNADGGKHYKVSTAKNLNVDSVKAGDTTVNNDGVTINNGPSMTKDGINANNTKVTNVADGVDAADAVNKGQLDKVDTKVSNVAQNVVNVLGGDATVNGNGDITMSNIGETGKGNINDAIKSVNDLAKKAAAEKTSVKAKEGRSNVTVTEGVNAAGGHEYTVDVERSVTNAGSDYVTVTNNHDADTNTTTYTVDVSAKTKASLAKADSAVQGLTSKDGNLNFTKGANGNVEVSFNDNLNVKNVTTDRVQVANGPSMTKDGINAAGKAISNVANGNVAADSKDAVNGGQLHETAKSVADVIGGGATVKDGKVVAGQNGIGNTGQNTVHGAIAAINQNTANNFNQIRGDLRKMDRDLRGGIAGALATAGLPQAFRPGKSMVAAAASTYRGQSGLAIGVSRISDNGKVILKVTGNTNSRGDFGGTIGAGYQW